MNVLFINNFFYERGGAEKSLFDTAALLKGKGHGVYFFASAFKDNEPYEYERHFVSDVDFHGSFVKSVRSISRVYHNFEADRKMRELLREIGGVDVAHINNIMYRIGPSIIRYLRKSGIPVVYHLRDYNLVCGAINLLADGRICEECAGLAFGAALRRRCKGGLAGGVVIATSMFFYHKIMKYFDGVSAFISPSRFLKDKYAELGFGKPIEVLPNFLDAGRFEPGYGAGDGSFVYFGRFSAEKGVSTLLRACRSLPGIRFKLIGEGPLLRDCMAYAAQNGMRNVTFYGHLRGAALYDEVRKSKAAVVPSEWYENNSKAIMEAMALGKPVIASGMGGNPELVTDGETGYLFDAFDAADLAAKIEKAAAGDTGEMGRRAREIIETLHGPESYYRRLMDIYGRAIAAQGGRR
ncbi:MAG: glycosyltransferase family 4 protein [Thermodesulfovibrionales bacterium]